MSRVCMPYAVCIHMWVYWVANVDHLRPILMLKFFWKIKINKKIYRAAKSKYCLKWANLSWLKWTNLGCFQLKIDFRGFSSLLVSIYLSVSIFLAYTFSGNIFDHKQAYQRLVFTMRTASHTLCYTHAHTQTYKLWFRNGKSYVPTHSTRHDLRVTKMPKFEYVTIKKHRILNVP